MIDPNNPDYSNTPVSNQRPVYDYRPIDPDASPCVSIVTPFFNAGAVFYETARAIFQQSLQQWEWIIVNDGSIAVESLQILNVFSQIDPRVRVVNLPSHLGVSVARNTGFREARTEFVVQVDSDDLIEPTAIEKWYWALISYLEYAFVEGYTVGFGAMQYTWKHGFHDRDLFLTENPAIITSMIRKSIHMAIGGFDEANNQGLEDWDFWLHCAVHGFWGNTVPEYHSWYRRRTNHGQQWPNWNANPIEQFLKREQQRYPALWTRSFPTFHIETDEPLHSIPLDLPCQNRLQKTKRRFLMILPWMQMGGADKFNLDLIQQLTALGWEITIVTTAEGDNSWAPAFERYTPDIFILYHFLKPADYPRFIKYLLQSRQIDIGFISNSPFGYQALSFFRAEIPDVAWISFCHMELEDGTYGAYPELTVQNQCLFDLNITSSQHLKRLMVNHGMDISRVEVSYTNIDSESWGLPANCRGQLRSSLGVLDDKPIILYIARLCQQKQPLVFARTMQFLKERNVDFRALVVGDGPDMERLRERVRALNLEDYVSLFGAQPFERVHDYFCAADIFFLPSQWEGIALTMYEAMAAGLPVVGADVGGQRELVVPDTGYLIQRSNPTQEAQEYAEILVQLIQDAGLRKKMGDAGRHRIIDHFRLDQLGQRMNALLLQSIQMHNQQPQPAIDVVQGGVSAVQAAEYRRVHHTWKPPESVDRPAEEPTEQHIMEYVYDPLIQETPLYRSTKRFLLPIYQFALAHGLEVVVPLKEGLRNVFNRK